MDFIFNVQSIMDMFGMVKISLLIEILKIFCASHYPGIKGWWAVSPKLCQTLLFVTHEFYF
jgi:hypothetical protein